MPLLQQIDAASLAILKDSGAREPEVRDCSASPRAILTASVCSTSARPSTSSSAEATSPSTRGSSCRSSWMPLARRRKKLSFSRLPISTLGCRTILWCVKLLSTLCKLCDQHPSGFVPPQRLPERVPINADLGGRYLELLLQFRSTLATSVPHQTQWRVLEFQQSLPFTFFATLPLDLINALVEQPARPRKDDQAVRFIHMTE